MGVRAAALDDRPGTSFPFLSCHQTSRGESAILRRLGDRKASDGKRSATLFGPANSG